MKNIIRASFYKMFHDRASWICLGGTAAWSLFTGWVVSWAAEGSLNLSDAMAMEKYWGDFFSYHAVTMPVLISSILLFTAEFKDKSWKLMVARGISIPKYYFAKVLCTLFMTVMICFVAILTGGIYAVAGLGAQVSVQFLLRLFLFTVAQSVAHGAAAVLMLSNTFWFRSGEVSASLNMLLLTFGNMALSKLERAWEIGDALTGGWAFAQPLYVGFWGSTDWIRILLVFAAYLIVCGVAVMLVDFVRDVE